MEYTIKGHDRSTCRDFERTFWIPPGGGYVREPNVEKPWTLGIQVCNGLLYTGLPLSARENTLKPIIQRERAKARRAEAKVDFACRC